MAKTNWFVPGVAAALGIGAYLFFARRTDAETLQNPQSPTPGHPSAPHHTTEGTMTPPVAGSETGTQFAQRILRLSGAARNQAIRTAIGSNNVPLDNMVYASVNVAIPGHTGTFFATNDYLGVGVNNDWIRTPVWPLTAQQIVDSRREVLPTKKMVDLIHQQAPIKISFSAKDPAREGVARDSTEMFKRSNASIITKLAGRSGQLIAGHKKDIVVGNLLARSPGKVIIYGAWDASGARIQPYSNVHSSTYEDYSHGVRGIKNIMIVDGHEMLVKDVLASPTLNGLISDEGVVPLLGTRYLS